MTVERLLAICKQQVAKGNGKKNIYLSDDDEGNGYHEMFYGFSENVAELDMWGSISEPNKAIILG